MASKSDAPASGGSLSFEIRGAAGPSGQPQRPDLRSDARRSEPRSSDQRNPGLRNLDVRWDRINSGEVIARARRVYFLYIEQGPSGLEPLGVVLTGRSGGRVVFDLPVLLPDEQYVPLEVVRGRGQRARGSRPSWRG
ncbi:hypothetical protein [Vulcanococcus limneticus]|uniref:hypothetical protein n=1 Tax=Vulcanococcus limneticus TaxID=2170428 RepID=UPI00398C11E8